MADKEATKKKATKKTEDVKEEKAPVEKPTAPVEEKSEEVVSKPETDAEAEGKTTEADTPKVAKAGKRSAKAIKEAEALAEKEERKAKIAAGKLDPSTDEEGNVAAKKGPVPVTRTRLERRGKAYRKSAEAIDKTKTYTPAEAMEILPKTSTVKFDASVEVHIRLGVDPKHADQNIRGSLVLPHGTGNTKRVAVFAAQDSHEAAKKAGADVVGDDTFLAQLDKEQIDFDVLIATPDVMGKLGKYARLLGPKGLMPNPKSGTVTKNVAKAVEEAKAGKVEYRVDKQGIIHQSVGKCSFSSKDLAENTAALVESVKQARPASVKGDYVLSIYATTSMGPSLKITA